VQNPEVIDKRYNVPEKAMEDPTGESLTPEYAYFASHAMFAAESIYGLMNGQKGQKWATEDWKNTVNVLIWRHNTYVCNQESDKTEYTAEFNKLIDDLRTKYGLCEPAAILRS
jgi:hypothetical protein